MSSECPSHNSVMKVKVLFTQSCPPLRPNGLWTARLCLWDSSGKITKITNWMGSPFPFQGIFLTQESSSGLPHCRWILYCLSHQGSWRILEWVAYPFSRGTSWPRNRAQVSNIADIFSTVWSTRRAQFYHSVFHMTIDGLAYFSSSLYCRV